jgi:tRNA-splicing ligase RtcB
VFKVFGEDLVDQESLNQMKAALALPIAVRGALMPDSHVGYGLPIGGVLATEGGVIPYAVGVDIACRVKLTIFDASESYLSSRFENLSKLLQKYTFFGVGATNPLRESHQVLDDIRWHKISRLKELKDSAVKQLGTSGSGNHFVEFGIFEVLEPFETFKVGEKFLALVSHSGSRGFGARVCEYYSKLAKKINPKYGNLAYLPIPGEGEEYWEAMTLAGDYASANHFLIHKRLADRLDVPVKFSMENHHNFAWKEQIDGKTFFVHRKGATPAHKGVLGYIPGTMASPGFLVRGLGNPESLNSSAHGAGRIMSRREAKRTLSYRDDVVNLAGSKGVVVLRAGRDESPKVYKEITQVLDRQKDCVEILGQFYPKIVVMAGDDEEAED